MQRLAATVVVLLLFVGGCLPSGSNSDSGDTGVAGEGDVGSDADSTAQSDVDASEADSGEADASAEVCGAEDQQERFHQLEEGLFDWCSVYLGSIHVPDTQQTDMSFFTGLRRIHGRLTLFRNEDMVSLHGLEQLERAGTFGVSNALLLTDLSGLEGLTEVDAELYVNGNSGLRSLKGLDNVRTVGELSIVGNYDLESLDGLSSLERVEGDVVIDATDNLLRSEIEAFLAGIEVQGTVEIRE